MLLFKSELKRTFTNDNINRFYIFSTLLWPIMALIHILYNLSVFPIRDIKIYNVNNEKDLMFYIFIGYFIYTIFANSTHAGYRLGDERYQGTLSQIFISPVNKLAWLYFRTFSQIVSTSWFFFIIFLVYGIVYFWNTLSTLNYVVFAMLVLLICSWIWASLVSSVCIILRDSTILFILLEGAQASFSGYRVPLVISPKIIRLVGSLIPLSYTIIYVRAVLIDFSIMNIILVNLIIINIVMIIVTAILIKYGELHLRRNGAFDIY
ncbi:MAG: hypothetical protein D8H99_24300 [Streptococcus sp.]|nr:MAG: hypothetical protein D8H99_24300 [Streptococcus sp.]